MKIFNELFSLMLPQRTGHMFQFAVFLSALAVVVAVLGVPILNKAAEDYAENGAFGIDRVITSSIEKSKRKTVRKSVLD